MQYKKCLLKLNIVIIFLVFSCNFLEKNEKKERTSNIKTKTNLNIASLSNLTKNENNKITEEKNIQNDQTQVPDATQKPSENKEDKNHQSQTNKLETLPKTTDKEQQNDLSQESSNTKNLKNLTIQSPQLSTSSLQIANPSIIIPPQTPNPVVATLKITTNTKTLPEPVIIATESKPSQNIKSSSFKINENNTKEIKLKAMNTFLSEIETNNRNLELYDNDICLIIKKDTNNEVLIGISQNDMNCNRDYDNIDTVPILKIEKNEVAKFKQAMLSGGAFQAKLYINSSGGQFGDNTETITIKHQYADNNYEDDEDSSEEKISCIFLDSPTKNNEYSLNEYSFAIKKSQFEKIKNQFEKL